MASANLAMRTDIMCSVGDAEENEVDNLRCILQDLHGSLKLKRTA